MPKANTHLLAPDAAAFRRCFLLAQSQVACTQQLAVTSLAVRPLPRPWPCRTSHQILNCNQLRPETYADWPSTCPAGARESRDTCREDRCYTRSS